MARVVRFYETGGPEVLRIDQVDVPQPDTSEIRIAVKAIGLNRAEAMFRSGQYIEDPKFPARIGYEAAGVVEAIGMGVQRFKPGDAVSLVPSFSMNRYGTYGDTIVAPASAAVKHPASLSWIDAAAVWMQYATAYGALIDIAAIGAGGVVLIPAASSSVGLAAIEIVNMVGGVSVALTRTSAKRDGLLEAGAAHVIATEEQDLVAETRKITGGRGARVAFDPVGGPTVLKLLAALSERGILFIYGALSTETTPLPLLDLLSKSLTVRGYYLLELTADPARLERAKEFVVQGLAAGQLKPKIAKVFPLEQIVEAHRYLESNAQIGKIVVTV